MCLQVKSDLYGWTPLFTVEEESPTTVHDMDKNGEEQTANNKSNVALQLTSNQGFKLDITWSEVDLDSYIAEAKPFIKNTITGKL